MDDHAPHAQDLRKGRHSQPDQLYLVTFCCHGRRPLLAHPAIAACVIDELLHSDTAAWSRTYAYVVMPDHVHWLIQLGRVATLSQVVGRVKGRAAARINCLRRAQGRLWQPGFHDHALRGDETVEAVGQYILHNPVRAGLVARAEEYPFGGLSLRPSP